MFTDIIERTQQRREQDKERFDQMDNDLCMLCHAYGADKRSLFIDCGYVISEAVPEAIDLHLCGDNLKGMGWYLRICKTCRGRLLGHLQDWRNERVAQRSEPKGHDGGALWDEDNDEVIPVRVNGVTVMMTPWQYEEYEAKCQKSTTPK